MNGELTEAAAVSIRRWRNAPVAEFDGSALRVWPGAPHAEQREWRLAGDGTFEDGNGELPLEAIAERAWPEWNRSLRVALGHAAGIEDEAAANRLGRTLIRESGIDMRSAREEAMRLCESFWDESVLDLLREVGEVAPRLDLYNAAARGREIVEQCIPGSRNVAALALRVCDTSDWEWSGSTVQSVQSFLGYGRWPKEGRKAGWRRFLRLAPPAAVQLDAAQARMLLLIPDRKDMLLERLTPGVMRTAAQFCLQQNHRAADELAAAMLVEAGRVRVDHGDLLTRFSMVEYWLEVDGWPEQNGDWGFGGWVRNLDRRYRDLRNEELAEQQARVATAANVSWEAALEPYRDGSYFVHELTTGVDLAEEGALMDHCVGTYSHRCTEGSVKIYSIKLGDNRIATASVGRTREDGNNEPTWRLSELKGFRNSPPSKDLQAVGQRLVKRVREARPGNNREEQAR